MNFEKRKKSDESGKEEWYCVYENCDRHSHKLSAVVDHAKKHIEWKAFGCVLCDHKTKTKKDLRVHVINKHSTHK